VAQLREAMDALFNTLLPCCRAIKSPSRAGGCNQAIGRQLRQICRPAGVGKLNMLALDAHAKIQKLYAAHLGGSCAFA
jgi:hypothetical protein